MSVRIDLPSGLVTFLFTDIEGSTRLARYLGDGYRTILLEHREILRQALSMGDGVELFTEGDALFVVFPEAAPALAACVKAQRDLVAHSWPSADVCPRVRMGLHSGNAVPREGEYTSMEVHRAARIAAAAHGGQVLCSMATARLADSEGTLSDDIEMIDLGLHHLRGFDGTERILQIVAPGLTQSFPRPRTSSAPRHNLPVLPNRFIGRAVERGELQSLLDTYSLITIVGPGGAGKTRLAVEVAGERIDQYSDGVWFIDMSTVSDDRLADIVLAETLGISSEPGRPLVETIIDYVRCRDMLVVIDTCDAVVGEVRGLISRIVSAGQSPRILATSREPLNVGGEMVWRIPPMGFVCSPQGGYSDAVALLVDRASMARGGRQTAPSEIDDFRQIARSLDGLPLALELAAARLRVLSTAQLAARIDDVLGTLDAGQKDDTSAMGRHRTMRATIDWSYRTLNPTAARLLRRLSVFAGPVDFSTIEWINGVDPLDPLVTLVDKSLIQAEPELSGATYRILDPIRAYALWRMVEAGEEACVRDHHVDWCLRTLQASSDDSRVTLSLNIIDPLAGEIRSALRWAATRGSARRGLAVASILYPWWRERGLAREGRTWIFQLYDRSMATSEHIPDHELSEAYRAHALLADADGEHAESLRFIKRAEEVARRSGNWRQLMRARAGRGAALRGWGRYEEAERICLEVIDWAQRDRRMIDALPAVYALAEILWQRGSLDQAADVLATARPVEAAGFTERGRRDIDMLLGLVALSRGDLVAAHDYLVVALRSRMRYGFHSQVCETLNAFAVRCALGCDYSMAARLFGAAQAARARLRCPPGIYRPFWAEHHSKVRTALGDVACDNAYAEGSVLTLDEAVMLALSIEHPDLVVGSTRF